MSGPSSAMPAALNAWSACAMSDGCRTYSIVTCGLAAWYSSMICFAQSSLRMSRSQSVRVTGSASSAGAEVASSAVRLGGRRLGGLVRRARLGGRGRLGGGGGGRGRRGGGLARRPVVVVVAAARRDGKGDRHDGDAPPEPCHLVSPPPGRALSGARSWTMVAMGSVGADAVRVRRAPRGARGRLRARRAHRRRPGRRAPCTGRRWPSSSCPATPPGPEAVWVRPWTWDAPHDGFAERRRALAVGEALHLVAGAYGVADAAAWNAGGSPVFDGRPDRPDGHLYLAAGHPPAPRRALAGRVRLARAAAGAGRADRGRRLGDQRHRGGDRRAHRPRPRARRGRVAARPLRARRSRPTRSSRCRPS